MSNAVQALQNTAAVFAAIELSKETWVVAIARPDRDQPSLLRLPGRAITDLSTSSEVMWVVPR